MASTVADSLYDRLIREGMEKGMEKGVYKKSVIAIRNITLKKIEPTVIAELLSVTPEFVYQVQKELQFEAEITALLQQKQSPVSIAKKLKLTVWLVEVIQEIRQ